MDTCSSSGPDASNTRDLDGRPPALVLADALEHARHVLPQQNPLDRFVHHNPLHHFEHLPFDEAVVEASAVLGTEPWWPEAAYRDALAVGRIQVRDVDAVLAGQIAAGRVAGVVERRALVWALMRQEVRPEGGASLQWTLTETAALSEPLPGLTADARGRLVAEAGGDARRAVRQLWQACETRRPRLPASPVARDVPAPRLRDGLVARLGRDPDDWANPMLIRWSAAFLDHGVGYWPMADRGEGFFRAFMGHFASRIEVGRPWRRGLRELAQRAMREGWTAEQTSLWCLKRLGHPVETWDDVVRASLLSLRGWSGMFARLEARPDVAPEPLGLPVHLADWLAVRLVLDWSTARHLLRGRPGDSLCERCAALPGPTSRREVPDPAWCLFQLAQILGFGATTLDSLGDAQLSELVTEAWTWSGPERRRLWHAAYERRFRIESLDAMGAHVRTSRPAPVAHRVQCAFCIDDREESFRRLLEEVAPWIGTLGVAGNFSISMYYQGLEHGHPVALGPAGAAPRHLVVERPREGAVAWPRWRGMAHDQVQVASNTLLGGALLALGGALSAIPLGLGVLSPRLYARLTRPDAPPATRLELEACESGADAHGLQRGFTLDEMVGIVRNTLELMSLVDGFAPLVFAFGHGSHSLNNPHEAAHDCGACGGGRGGPNARAFAQMANDPRVRERLAADGIHIPGGTWFVGGFHDTAGDQVELYDLDAVPEPLRSLLDEVREALEAARRLDAVERCRKFRNTPLGLDPEAALARVEARSVDLTQPRPEYGHCTNAICLVGERRWSRGLFLDRRAFLCSYDPAVDPDGSILARLLAMVMPVGAGINLEYWFSVVDPAGYGCGTKLPHNITGLVGVMDGHKSDLRTGLPWQMVELHEPVRLLCVVQATPAQLERVAAENEEVGRLVANGWVQLAAIDPDSGALQVYESGGFRPYVPERATLPAAASSSDWFGDARGLLPFATIAPEAP